MTLEISYFRVALLAEAQESWLLMCTESNQKQKCQAHYVFFFFCFFFLLVFFKKIVF